MTSALGQTRRFRDVCSMSGLPPTADVSRPGRHFAFVPRADVVKDTPGVTHWPARYRLLIQMTPLAKTSAPPRGADVGLCCVPVAYLAAVRDANTEKR